MSRSSLNGEPDEDDGPEDTTADDLFQDLAESETGLGESADGDEIYEELAEESPEEIIAAADEAAEDHPVDDAILPDEDALDELLLSDRRKEEGFLWVDTGREDGDDAVVQDDVVDEWADAFAEASDVDPGEDAPTTESTDGERGGDEPGSEITIDVPDPDEVEGARAAAEGWAADPTDDSGDDATEEGVDAGTTSDERVDAEPTAEEEDGDETPTDDAERTDSADGETADDDSAADGADGADDAEDADGEDDADGDSPGLLGRLLSALSPF